MTSPRLGPCHGNHDAERTTTMGLLIDGRWQDQWYDTKSTGGAFKRQESAFRNWITADGSIGGFKAEAGRYHLYVSLACPWAHRTLILRKLKRLEDAISVSVVASADAGARLDLRRGRRDRRSGQRHRLPASGLHRAPIRTTPAASPCRCCGTSSSDHRQQRIVRDHPDAEFGVRRIRRRHAATTIPQALRAEIDAINALVYDRVNNGVYKRRLRHHAGGL